MSQRVLRKCMDYCNLHFDPSILRQLTFSPFAHHEESTVSGSRFVFIDYVVFCKTIFIQTCGRTSCHRGFLGSCSDAFHSVVLGVQLANVLPWP